jgi:tyrosyl-tRNA synthetase
VLSEEIAAFRSAAAEVVGEEELAAKLARGRPLRIKMGFDPSSPDLHLGHWIGLDFLARLQRRGHIVVFLVGDFTARIGDPTGRSRTRPALSAEQVAENARTYAAQVGRVLDLDRAELRFNSEWVERLTAGDFLRLMAQMTVARMLERDDFSERYRAGVPISLHEFLYPLIQGYDSVALQADVEVGGTDQLFNMLVGRNLQRSFGQEPQVVIGLPLLEGTDGKEKMSKSLGNAIGICDPPDEMYGKTMSIPDELLPRWLSLLAPSLVDLSRNLAAGELNPRDAKAALAEHLVERFHGKGAGQEATARFDRVFRQKQAPEEVPEVALPRGDSSLAAALLACGFAASRSECRRLLAQGGVRLGGERVSDLDRVLPPGEHLLQVGKRRFARVRVPG